MTAETPTPCSVQVMPLSSHECYVEVQSLPDFHVSEPQYERGPIRVGAWRTHLCYCQPPWTPIIWMPCFFPCVSLAQVFARLGSRWYTTICVSLGTVLVVANVTAVLPLLFPSLTPASATSLLDSFFFCSTALITNGVFVLGQLVFVFATAIARRRVRRRFEIPGNLWIDLGVSTACNSCALAQMAIHVRSFTPGSCDFQRPDVLAAYEVDAKSPTKTSRPLMSRPPSLCHPPSSCLVTTSESSIMQQQ
ncbi:hypothetical protein ATCC90586_002975 [Pythium insidiosum]|nr:hypothetical protein ATCC90586_002975 [Pythium insidiosum]